ncbi:MAG: hypothetical protein AAGG09_19340 [Pseudomonadota bacterium]
MIWWRRRLWIGLSAVALAGCELQPAPSTPPVARLSPPQLQLCAEGVLAQRAIRTEVAPLELDTDSWRLRLMVLATPPSGWLEKGDLIHDGARVTYLPNGATEDLLDDRIERALAAIAERCI